jgi:hypothetical protein
MASLSLCSIPAVLGAGAPTSVMLRQWCVVYNNGKAIPALAVAAALSYGVSAYGFRTRGLAWRGVALAGALSVAAVPFTLAFIMPTNNELETAADNKMKPMSDGRARYLITKWTRLNMVRAFLQLSGAVVGLWSLLAWREPSKVWVPDELNLWNHLVWLD